MKPRSVCGKTTANHICPTCGFDATRDYFRYPTLNRPSPEDWAYLNEARRKWQEKQSQARKAASSSNLKFGKDMNFWNKG